MKVTTQYRRGSYFKVTFPDFPSITIHPQYIKIFQEKGKHDILEITCGVIDPFYEKTLKTGVPVFVKYTNGKINGSFAGYVYDVTLTTHSSNVRDTVIRCISAGFVLKKATTKVWNKKTASQIVQDICKEEKLKAVVTPHKQVFSQQYTSGQTRWEKIQELAQRIGYVAQVVGVEVHFHPIDKMIDSFLTSVPVLSFFEEFYTAFETTVGQTLDYFKPTIGAMNEASHHTKKDKTISGIDIVTGKPYSYTSKTNFVGKKLRSKVEDSIFEEVIHSRVTEDVKEAKLMAEGLSDLSRFPVHAEGQAQGDPRISPYRTIEIQGTREATDGYWIVTKAVHTITHDGRYNVAFNCVTDGRGINQGSSSRNSSANVVPVRNITAETAGGIPTIPSSASITLQQQVLTQSSTGFSALSRRWIS